MDWLLKIENWKFTYQSIRGGIVERTKTRISILKQTGFDRKRTTSSSTIAIVILGVSLN